ncbi:MAG: TetR/AcrR family transcriptional regulator [Leptospira sp.]|nr:TetR/AcrR family transcriptional regulator [Leptospira sp.]
MSLITAPTQSTKRNTREKIMEEASILFMEKGFSATSVDDILNRVSIAKGTFYHHFISKEALLETITDNLSRIGFDEILERMKLAKPENPISKLNSLFRVSMEWKDDNIESMMYLIEALYKDTNTSLRISLRNKSRKLNIPLFEEILLEGKKKQDFQFDNSFLTAEMIIILLEGLSDHLTEDLIFNSNVPSTEVIQNYQTAIERLLLLSPNNIRLIDWNSYKSIKSKIQLYKQNQTNKKSLPNYS